MHKATLKSDPPWREPLEEEAAAARAVQTRLLRIAPPRLRTLEMGAFYRPALGVGGDFYDLFRLGSSRLGLLLGDIAGKGVSAAILMASLQATLRSHYAGGLGDLPQVLRSVNRLFFDWTEPHHFATLFLGQYDDRERKLTYANCGHLPPMLLRASGRLERLDPTATVVGILPEWDCGIRETHLDPGDLLILFSDGLTEGCNAAGEEFGEGRVLDLLRTNRHRPLESLIRLLVRAQKGFCGSRSGDDTTLVVARAAASLEEVQ